MLKATVAGLLTHKLRLALSSFSIVLGVAFACSTLTFSNGLQATFDAIFQNPASPISVVVQGHVDQNGTGCTFTDPHRPVPMSLLTTIKAVSGVQNAAGEVCQPDAVPLDANNKSLFPAGPPKFGASWEDPAISQFHLTAGSAPAGPHDVVIDSGSAQKKNIHIGQTLNYVIKGGTEQPFTVSGIASFSGAGTGATFSFFQLGVVQKSFNLEDKYNRIDVAAQSGISQTDLRNQIAQRLPSYAEAQTELDFLGGQLGAIDTFFGFVRTALLVFALIALFVGSYIIINTLSILIAQRTRELALLRALGATRFQVFRLVLVESFFTGVFGSLVGALLSIPLAHGLYSAVGALGSGLPKANLSLSASTFLIGMVLGTGITVVASVFPARKASRVSPVEAIRDASDAAQPLGAKRIAGSAFMTFAGGALIAFGLFSGNSNSLVVLGVGAFVLYIGASLLAPLTVVPVAGVLGRPIARLRGTPGKLARTNAMRAPRRAAATAAALMIGVSLVVGIAVITASVKASTRVAIQQSLVADYIVFSGGGGGGEGSINPATTKALQSDPHFSTVGDIKIGNVLIRGSSTSVIAYDPAIYQRLIHLDVATGDPASLGQPGTIFVDQQDATAQGLRLGDTVAVNFTAVGNTLKMRVGCIFNANAITNGYLISAQTYAHEFTQPRSFIILAAKAPGVTHDAGLAALNQDLRKYPTVRAFDSTTFLALQSSEFDSLTSVLDVFLFMAILIASLGIVNTLALSILERTRELGLLRAIGLTRRQTRTMIRWESVLISFLGLVLGAVLGIALGAAVVRALASTGSLGHLAIPWGNLIVYAIAALVIGLVAAILPARRAARLNVLDAIYSE